MDLKQWVRDVPDYPKPGILFRDITPVLAHPPGMRYAVDRMAVQVESLRADIVACIDARGFLFGAPIAVKLGLPLVPLRKAGKLPPETVGADYSLEYGTARIEVRAGAFRPGQRVVVVDDLLATGGTATACGRVIAGQSAVVAGYVFMIELAALGGRKTLQAAVGTTTGETRVAVHALITY